jgi:GH24 family phage-related lysozyme (muramidase)
MLTYYYIISRNKKLSFSKNHNNIKKKVFQNLIKFVYSAGKKDLGLEKVLKSMNAA